MHVDFDNDPYELSSRAALGSDPNSHSDIDHNVDDIDSRSSVPRGRGGNESESSLGSGSDSLIDSSVVVQRSAYGMPALIYCCDFEFALQLMLV